VAHVPLLLELLAVQHQLEPLHVFVGVELGIQQAARLLQQRLLLHRVPAALEARGDEAGERLAERVVAERQPGRQSKVFYWTLWHYSCI
jgi:hypothetical protein